MSIDYSKPQENLEHIRSEIKETNQLYNSLRLLPGESLRCFEQRTQQVANKLLSLKIAEQTQMKLIEEAAREKERELKKHIELNFEETTEKSKLKNHGWREIKILFLGGYEITIVSRFYALSKARAKRSKGVHLGLMLVGIFEQCSPSVLDLLAKAAVSLGSLRDAQNALADQGIHVSLNRLTTAVQAVSLRARSLRSCNNNITNLDLKGRKIIVSVDGGRIRIREYKKGPKTKKGRRRYRAEWREPKLLCIYFLKASGEVDRDIPPILDGTMGNINVIFDMLIQYLSMLNIDKTTEVQFVADGSDGIWNRVGRVEKAVTKKEGKFSCLLDYYHMKGYLHKIADSQKAWSSKERKRWINKVTKYLFEGQIEEFEKAILSIRKGSHKKSVLRTSSNYLLKNARRGRLNYGEVRAKKLPIGSGVIESTVRRVVNLRLKGASVCWKLSTAEPMLLLRSLYKANRWKDIENVDVTTINSRE